MNKDIDLFINIITNLYNEHKNNEFVYSKFKNIIVNLPRQLKNVNDNYVNNKQKNEQNNNLVTECINKFFKQYLFLYININTEQFILYENNNFKIFNSNDFCIFIYNFVNNFGDDELMKKYKYKIESSIICEVKKQLLVNAIPTSFTIQKVINLFYPIHFNKRELVKIFLINLGNNIQKKNFNITFLMSKNNKRFINTLSTVINTFIGNIDYLYNIKYTYNDNKNCKFIPAIFTYYSCSNFTNNIIDIIIVSCHYSNRFDINSFISKCNNSLKKKLNIFNTFDNILIDFLKKYTSECNYKNIKKKDMFFLWKLFISEEMFPNMYKEKEILNKIGTYVKYENKSYLNIQSDILLEVHDFISFIKESFYITIDGDEFEMDEIIYIFANNKEININYINREVAVLIFQHYIKEFNIQYNKINSVKCKYWDKNEEVSYFIKSYLESEKEIKSSYNAYNIYIQNYKNKVNKCYFEQLYDKYN